MSDARITPTIAFVVDCGGDVGWGHFVRSQALASELRGRGCDVSFIVNGELPPFADKSFVTLVHQPPGTVGIPAWAFEDAEAIVLDLWRYSEAVRDDLPGAPLVITLIDGRDPPFESDLTIDPNVSAESSSSRTRLSGGDYLIMRPEFDDVSARAVARASSSLVVSFGGTERRLLLSRVLAAAADANVAQVVALVPRGQSGHETPSESMPNVSWHTSVNDMSELLLGMEAGLIAAGTLLHEACATGLPCAVVALTPDQELEAKALAQRGAILYLGEAAELSDATIEAALAGLRDESIRAGLSRRAREVVDGGGRKRVADAVLARLGRERT